MLGYGTSRYGGGRAGWAVPAGLPGLHGVKAHPATKIWLGPPTVVLAAYFPVLPSSIFEFGHGRLDGGIRKRKAFKAGSGGAQNIRQPSHHLKETTHFIISVL